MPKFASAPFDVRNGIHEAELDDESIQLVYDAINRMVVLIGDIPFSRLFLAPIREIGPLVAPRVKMAARYGLLREPALVEQLIGELIKKAGARQSAASSCSRAARLRRARASCCESCDATVYASRFPCRITRGRAPGRR